MNELIQKLVVQAKESVPAGLQPSEWLEVYHEKFAELIVRECATICDTKRAEYTILCKDSTSFEKKNIYAEGEFAAHQVRLLIQKHFGVEE